MSIDQQFVEYVIKSLVTYPDDVIVERTIDEKGVLLTLTVNPEDLGRVIGKRGATAQSVRTLLRALGTKNEARYNMKIVDNGEPKPEREARKNDQTDSNDSQVASDADIGSAWSSSPTDSNDDSSSYGNGTSVESDEASTARPEVSDSDEEETAIERTRRELEDLDDLDV